MKLLSLLCLFFVAHAVVAQLGSLEFSYADEDPSTGASVDTVIERGESLEVLLTLNPAPLLPIRFDVISSLPDILKVSHNRITFNRGQTQGTITVESPSNGKIGVATIIVTPEKPGLFRPNTFDVLVQGNMEISIVDSTACVGVGVATEFLVSVYPPSPESVQLDITSSNGEIADSATIPLGQSSVSIFFTGGVIDDSIISATTSLYTSKSISFRTLGTIQTGGVSSLVESSPAEISVSVLPENPTLLPTIFVTPSNAVVSPSSFTLSASGTSFIEVIPTFPGGASLSYRANDYCPHFDFYNVFEAADCEDGSIPNVIGNTCVPCPGGASNICNNQGTCGFSKCSSTAATCFCLFPYIGSDCQFDSQVDQAAGIIDQHILDESNFRLNLENLENTVGKSKFLVPGNILDAALQPGRVVLAGYYGVDSFFGAVDPSETAPGRSVFTGIGWNWETLCGDNALIHAPFNAAAPVSVKVNILPAVFTPKEILQVDLFVYDEASEMWMNSIDVCTAAGFNSTVFVDLNEMTLLTSFCTPGQYAVFVVPVSLNVPGAYSPTQNTNRDSRASESLNGGFRAEIPLPQAVVPDFSAYRPSLPRDDDDDDSGSSSGSIITLSITLVTCAALLFI